VKLIDTVRQLDGLPTEHTIYVRHPWSTVSESAVAEEGSGEEKRLRSEGLSYFLEVFIAKNFLDDWKGTMKQVPTDDQLCTRLIEYASNDA